MVLNRKIYKMGMEIFWRLKGLQFGELEQYWWDGANIICWAISNKLKAIFFYRCGQETRVIPRILQLRSHWLKSEKESVRLQEAGISKEVMNSAIAQFCLEIIAKHGEPASRLCNKDPLTLKMGSYVIELFPQVN